MAAVKRIYASSLCLLSVLLRLCDEVISKIRQVMKCACWTPHSVPITLLDSGGPEVACCNRVTA